MERNTTLWERAAALVLALFMVFSMMPLQAFALGELVTITGADTIAVEMDSITLTANVQNPPQGAEISYVWSVPDNSAATITAASDTNTATLTRVDDKNGKVNVTVTATYTNGATTETLTSQPYSVLVKRNADMTVSVSPESPTTVDTPLTATVGGTDKDAATLQWQKKNGESYEDISGATENTYTPDAPGEYQVVATVAGNDSAGLVGDSVTSASVTVKKNTIADGGIRVLPNETGTLTYGDELSTSLVTFTVTAPVAGTMYFSKSPLATNPGAGTPNVVLTGSESTYTGTLSVANNTSLFDVSSAGDNKPLHYWFEPTESNKYDAKSGSFTYNVAKKTISIASISLSGSKTYDGNTALTVAYSGESGTDPVVASVTLDGVVGGDVVSVSGGLAFTLADKNVGSQGVSVSVENTGITLDGTAAGNYTVSTNLPTITSTVQVVPRTVTLASVTIPNKIYDGTNAINKDSVQYGFKNGDVISDDSVSVTGAFYATADGNVGSQKAVTLSGNPTLTNPNYTISDLAASIRALNPVVNITALPLQVGPSNKVASKVSDGTKNAPDSLLTGREYYTVTAADPTNHPIPESEELSVLPRSIDRWQFVITYHASGSQLTGIQASDFEVYLKTGDTYTETSNYCIQSIAPFYADIKAIAPDTSLLDLTTSGTGTFTLKAGQNSSDDVTVSFVPAAGFVPGDEQQGNLYWYKKGDTLRLADDSQYKMFDQNHSLIQSLGMEKDVHESQEFYLFAQDGKEYGPVKLKNNYDPDAPVITTVSAKEESTGNIDFGGKITYTVQVSDAGGSGLNYSAIKYCVLDTNNNQDFSGVTWQTPENIQKATGENSQDKYTFTVTAPATGYLYVQAVDYAQNSSISNATRALVIEETPPTLEVTVENEDNYAQSHKITITAIDKEDDGGNRSGVSKVSFVLDKVEKNGTFTSVMSETDIDTNDAPADFSKIDSKTITVEQDATLKGKLSQTDQNGDYRLTVYAYDFCGNRSKKIVTLRLDNTAPEVTLSMSRDAHYENYYYNADDCAVNVTITDKNLTGGNESSASVSAWKLTFTDSNGTNSTSITYPADADVHFGSVTTDAETGLQTFTATIPATALATLPDGVITVSVKAYDNAGNEVSKINSVAQGMTFNNESGTASFILDKTPPVLNSVNYSGHTNTETADNKTTYYYGLENGIGDNSNIVATFNLTEANFFPEDVTVQLFKGEEEIHEKWSYGWSGTTLTVTALGTIGDGSYRVQVSYIDPAGHQMTGTHVSSGRYTAEECVNIIDTVRPKAVFDITQTPNVYEEADYYNSDFTASFTVTDANYDAGRITAKYAKGPVTDWSNDGTAMTRTDGVYTFTTAGEQKFYTFHIEGTDKANNKLSIVAGTGISSKDDFDTNVNEGKFTSHPKALDTTAPIATIDFNATATGNHYYEETTDGVTVKRAYYGITPGTIAPTVKVTDANGVDYSRIYRGVNVSEENVMTPLVHDTTAPGSNAEMLALVAAIGDSGDYTFSIFGTDKAGNVLTVIEKKKTSDSDNNSDVQNNQNNGYGTLNNKYTTYPKTLDLAAPTVKIDYTPLADTHYYADTSSAYYKDDFAATYTFADNKGLDCSKLYTGVNVTDISQYTQQGTDILKLNDDNERQTVIPIKKTEKENGSYTFSVYGEDKAGNPLTVVEKRTTDDSAMTDLQEGYNKNTPYTSQYHKVLDTVAPAASFEVVPAATPSHPEMQTLGGKNRFYLNTGFTATYSVTETNYDNSKVHAYYGHSNPEDYLNNSVSAGQEYIGSEKIRSYTSNGDGLYIFKLTGEDRAGNQVVAVGQSTALGNNPLESTENNTLTSYIITVDTVKPVLQAAIGDYYAAELKENAYSVGKNSPYRSEQSARLTLTATDPSPKVIQYATTSTRGDTSDGDVTALGSYNQGGSVLTLSRDFSGEQVFAMKALVVADLAGNVSTAPANVDGNVSNYIYLDVTPPTEDKLAPTVSLIAHESGQGRSVRGVDLYNSTVTVEAKISDPGFGQQPNGTGGTSSGLFTLHYVVQHNDSENWNGQMEGKVATTSANHGITTDADGIVYYTQSHQGIDYSSTDPVNEALVGEDTITFTFDAATFNYNDISIRVWAEDNTGHKSGEAIYRFGIDTTLPKIQVTYDNNDARNEKYFKADRTATVVVTERNFDPDNTAITTEVGHSGWSYAAGGLANGDDDTWNCTVPYTEDADYTFNVTAKDLVGHDAGEADYGDSVAPREFTVDKTKPVIEITFDNNDVRNGRYYKENRTATIHIEEHNFAAEDAEVTTTAEIAEGGVAAPAAGSWGSAGDSNTAQVPFNADGDYTMQVKFQDKAGNEAEPKEVELFTVDTTAPELTFSINDEAFEAGSYTPRAYNGQVVPGITYHDINYDGAGTQMSIVGAKNVNSQILSGAPAEDAMGGVYTCENIAETPENDDVYTCTGRVVDMAGNESTVDFMFSVNRYGSNYLLTPDTQALVDNYYTNSAPNLGVSEINVNTLKFEEITYALNGDIRTLQPGTDYQVTESGSETSWKQYDYTIFNSNFDREGVYDITIYSEDEAGNANSNHTERVKEYSKNISFVLDQTAPSITISGVDEGGIYDTDTRSVTVAYGENFAMDNLIITNGEKTETYTAEQLQATGGTLEFVVPASREKQSVKVTAADKAGNIATIESPRFVLSSSLFVRWVNNTPVMVGTISFGVLAVAAVADYLRKGFLFALLHKHTGVKH